MTDKPAAPASAPHAPPAPGSRGRWLWWLLPLVVAAAVGGGYYAYKKAARLTPAGGSETISAASQADSEGGPSGLHAEVEKPTRGLLERRTTQPGNAISFQSIQILAEVSGYIDKQPVDIGSVVKKGDLLVEIRVPDLKAEQEKQEAAVELAKAQVEESRAAVATARADLASTVEKIAEAHAKVNTAKATLSFRSKQRKRYEDLLATGSIDARLIDEQEDRYEAANEGVISSEAVLRSSRAAKLASEARVDQARADLHSSQKKVSVAQSELARARAMVDFATIRAPFDGVVTRRNYFPNDFVHAATGGQGMTPLLALEDTQTMRMVVPIPDRDVPYCDEGDEAIVHFDALPGREYKAKVSRVAGSEDRQTKTMRCEIDIRNPDGRIRQGMYGSVTIILANVSNALTIPATALTGPSSGDAASVYVVRQGKAHLVPIRTGLDNGVQVEVREGLSTDDNVVVRVSGSLEEGTEVEASRVEKKTKKAAHH